MSKPANTPAEGGAAFPEPLRRRVIFELRLEELPLLQAAERRHGTKRAALVKALEAENECEALANRLAEGEARIAELEQALSAEQGRAGAAASEREKEQERTKAVLAKAEKELSRERAGAKERSRSADREQQEAYARLEEELAELERLAIDELYCARCNRWVEPSGWAWKKGKEGRYAFHRSCGDHGHGLVGASSWLAWRAG